MSYIGTASDVEQEKNLTEFRRNRSNASLIYKQADNRDDSDSEISDSGNFLAKGAFLLTPSHELSMERAALICEKLNFKGCFSLTKTATGILFKFSHPEDYQAVVKKGFHKVTGARFYKKVAIPCRPQKTFTLFVLDVPEELPVEDVRHSLYRFNSVVEVVRLVIYYPQEKANNGSGEAAAPLKPQIPKLPSAQAKDDQDVANKRDDPPPPIRITLASLEEYNTLLQSGLDFYGATFFPTEANLPLNGARIATKRGRWVTLFVFPISGPTATNV